jgi:hypothetical protein
MYAESYDVSWGTQSAQFYRTLSDFSNETNKFTGILTQGEQWHFKSFPMDDSAHFGKYAEPLYCDYRWDSGESNWGNPKVQLNTNCEIYKHGMRDPFGVVDLDMFIEMDGIPVSPPAHLHLCLHNWNESPDGVRPGRTWKVSTIVDDQGIDLSSDPDWTYYSDNTMRFEKADRFIFTPGEMRSAKELDLFGTAAEHATVIGSYTVTKDGSGTVSLKLVFPNFTSVLTVVESRFGYVKLSGESGGKRGILELIPLD